jgi:hypothetical protein
MRRTIGVLAILAGCASTAVEHANSTSTSTARLTPPVTVPSSVPQPTTAPTIGRDARLAVARCNAALGPRFYSAVGLDAVGGSTESLTAAQTACDEATLQLKVDAPEPGSVGAKLALAIAELNVALADAKVHALKGDFQTSDYTALQTAVDKFSAAAG